MFDNWMEGVNPDDYCPKCGTPLHDSMTFSDGTKKMYAHEIDSGKCKQTEKEIAEMMAA